MVWMRLLGVPAVVIPILGLLAYGFTRDPKEIPSPLIGKPAPPFTLTLFDGKTLRLEDLQGKVVFLNFWASWCPPCRAEARTLEAAWQEYKDQDIVFLGIDIQDTEEYARAFLREFGITYPNGRDGSGKVAIDYGVWGIPETFFIDREGRITYKHIGALGWPTITAKLEEARRGGGFIPGVRPGKKTAEYIDRILTRITLPGAIFLALISVLPDFLIKWFNVPFFFGGTSLLIVVGVALDTVRQMESHLLMRHHEGFLRRKRVVKT